jgi:iron complex transport system substrate-binding protein
MSPLLALLACSSGPTVDDAPPDTETPRWVSLSPAVTETIATLGRQDVLVGRSEWCTLPPSVTALPAVGSALTPDLEALARLQPTAILVDGSDGVDRGPLERIAPVTVLPWLSVAQVADSVEALGGPLERTEEAMALGARLRRLDVAPPSDGPEVLLSLTEDPRQGDVWYVRSDSLHGAVLHAAGGRNALPDAAGGAPSLSLEGLLELDPDVIVVMTSRPVDDAVRAEVLANWAPLTPLGAVAQGRIGVLGGPAVLSPGPAVLDTAVALRSELARLGATP